ncbi:flagellar basal body rod modification protein [Pseudorhodobacter turbinis]|uniref:Basal-body rod modification protein FlgD n=1 Tax=Pseudorhodobacter turbinis TaxID=2500533 RepID=A0A4P8EFR1_9RHOB|nr:flagellar hook capping FlgD N-terminal domain-containing protein [Pseudorhodobacter turbinis]QCO55315.1 flagellar basal body rod modification protein [Pseudorhodobacter turbinis]
MDVTATNYSTTTTKTADSADTSKISSDFDTFLKMLTAQIQNQDPMNPVESSDFAVQLATFSSVEQQSLTNQKLDTLSGLMGVQGMTQLAPWVGQEARSAGPVYMNGTPVTIAPDPNVTADRAVLVVKDISGNTLAREDVPVSGGTYEWTGKDISGADLPSGVYTLSLESYRDGVEIETSAVESYASIQEVQMAATGPQLILAGGVSISAEQVTALRQAA